MSVTCGILTVRKPANITATDMIMSTADCDEPCSSTVTITWTNTGGRTATVTPAIVVNGVRTAGAPMTLIAGASDTRVFELVDRMEGVYTICPDPN